MMFREGMNRFWPLQHHPLTPCRGKCPWAELGALATNTCGCKFLLQPNGRIPAQASDGVTRRDLCST